MNWLADLLKIVQDFVNATWPALGVMLWNYEEQKVAEKKGEVDQLQEKLQVEKNHESVDEKYAGVSDADVLRDAVSNGGGTPSDIQTDDDGGTGPADADTGRKPGTEGGSGSSSIH